MTKIDFWKKYSESFFLLVYMGLVWGIMGNYFWTKGLIFSTDQSWGEFYPWTFSPGENLQLLRPIFFLWSQFLPMHLLQKLVYILVFALLYGGGKKLFSLFSENRIAIFLGTVFLVFNPFFYERLVEGAQNVYYSYALYPWFFYWVLRFWEKISWRKGLTLAGLSVILCGLSIYNILIIFLVIGILGLAFKVFQKKNFSSLFFLLAGIIFANLFWIVPTISQKSLPGQWVFSGFSSQDFYVFEPVALAPLNVELTVLSLSGHWAEKFHRFPVVAVEAWEWQLASGLLLGILLLGIGTAWKKIGRKKIGAILFLGFLFYFLSLGTSSILSERMTLFLIEHCSFYRGMRETSKFMGVLPVIYGIFLVLGIEKIVSYLKRKGQFILLVMGIGILIFWVSPLWGLTKNQLKPVSYPSDWYELRSFFDQNLNQEKKLECEFFKQNISGDCYSVLNLPWHYYQYFNFADRTIINPIPRFFSGKILLADNTEIGEIQSHSRRKESLIIEKLIEKNRKGNFSEKDWLENLKGLGVEYILLTKEEDWQEYAKVFSQKENFLEVFQSPTFLVWKIEF